jgi:Helix-turn-helix of DDE superfamily endonuclease
MKWDVVSELNGEDFIRATGVKDEVFNQMIGVVLQNVMNHFGRPFKLDAYNMLLITLLYWRNYDTMKNLSHTFGISESAVCRNIQLVENWLVESGLFRLEGPEGLSQNRRDVIVLDVTEVPIERPQVNQELYYSGKKKTYPKNSDRHL